MPQTAAILTRQAALLFQPGRESLWSHENGIAADGELLDQLLGAHELTLIAAQQLLDARKSIVESTDQNLAKAEADLRAALAAISKLRQHVAAVPSNFGEG